jgi:uncharacterized protein (TIGR03083 family)
MTSAYVVAELEALAAAARALSPGTLHAPSGCPGWRVLDVVTHLAHVVEAQQSAFANMLAGSTDTPPYADAPFDPPDTALAALNEAIGTALQTYGKVTDDDAGRQVPLPFGTFPAEIALDIVLLEYGVHRYDIAAATDPHAEPSGAATEAVMRLLPAFIASYAVTPAPDALAYRLESPAVHIDVSGRDGAWVLEPGSPDTTTVISGADGPVALFALGRIGADDPRITVTGTDAAAFKSWFPGP